MRTIRTWIEDLAGARRFAQQIAPSAWANYTPTWTAASANPTLGDATLTGRYSFNESWCHVCIQLTFGSTSAAGTDAWYFSLPILADNAIMLAGSAVAHDTSTTTWRVCGCELADTTKLQLFVDSGTSLVGPGVPFTWATGDVLRMQLLYPVK